MNKGKVTASRRIGAESSATRALILQAAEQVFLEEGHAAASTRRVAARAGLKPSLVHYYFPTTEDLLVALLRKGIGQSDDGLEQALSAADPLQALWGYFTDPDRIALALEFMTLARHRPAISAEIAAHSEKMRAHQVTLFTRVLGERMGAAEGCSPAGLSLVLAGIGRALVMEGALGVVGGHDDARDFVAQWLGRLTGNSATGGS